MRYLIPIFILALTGCEPMDCSEQVEDLYWTCAEAEPEVSLPCSERCFLALEQATCDNFKTVIEEDCHDQD